MFAHALKSARVLSAAIDHVVRPMRAALRSPQHAKTRPAVGLETLENRQLFSLLGVSPDYPITVYNSTGHIDYDTAAQTFDVTATPVAFQLNNASPVTFIDPSATFAIHINVNNLTGVGSSAPGDDFKITGDIDSDGDSVIDYTGTLLTGELLGFGYFDSGVGGTTDNYDFRFSITGGTLSPLFGAGKDIAISMQSENSTFNGLFLTDFEGGAKGNVGSTPKLPPPPGRIAGTKYDDKTGNGLSGDDTGLGSVTINLYNDANTNGAIDGGEFVTSTVTDGSGNYSFENLAAGQYIVQEVAPGGYYRTTPTTSDQYVIVVAAGGNNTGINFANAKFSQISGQKFKDLTGNGLTADDTTLNGTTINLYLDNGDGNFSTVTDSLISTQVTAGSGVYSFTNLRVGTYFVQEVVPAGYSRTTPISQDYYKVELTLAGSNVTKKDFANVPLGSICGQKFKDLTGNGLTGDDTALDGTTIKLYRDNGDNVFNSATDTFIASQATAGGGKYQFNGLLPGKYFVQEVVPTGYQRTTPISADYYTVALAAGATSNNNNFANVPLGQICGNKYLDKCGDGLDGNDTGLGGTTIKLFIDRDNSGTVNAADGAAVASTVSANGSGAYQFINLLPAKYLVQEVVPTGYVRTAPALTDTYVVNLAAGATSGGNNFANFELDKCCITNVKYCVDGTYYSTLTGNTNQGSTVKVTFTVPAGQTDMVTLVSYKAPSSSYVASEAAQQTIYEQAGGITYGPGTYTITVHCPDSYYQCDFVCGCAIKTFGAVGSNIFYSAQQRLFSADNDGLNSDMDNMAAGPSFWKSTNGQNLIKSFGGAPTSTALATWLSGSYAKLYGNNAGANKLVGKKNTDVAALILSLATGGSSKAADANVLATALSVYASTTGLGGSTAAAYFRITSTGLGNAKINVQTWGGAFGVSNNSVTTVNALLAAANNNASSAGVLNNGSSSSRSLTQNLFDFIADRGGVV